MVPATAGLPAVFGEAVGHTKQPNILYVTLSHCWGQSQHYTLNPNTVADLKDGTETEKPPKTLEMRSILHPNCTMLVGYGSTRWAFVKAAPTSKRTGFTRRL